MPGRLLAFLTLALALLVPAATASAAYVPEDRQLYRDGPSGRYLLGGEWLFRLDPQDQGLRSRYQRQSSKAGWTGGVRVPNAWNAGDTSDESMAGTIGWYRKDFSLPSAKEALRWVLRFESVNYRSTVWLNGRPIGTNKGAYVPFEMDASGLKRRGTNRLVIRVDNRRRPTDFPPSGLTATGRPTGGWWNYGGLLREVYLRRVDTVDWREVRVQPELACSTCDAKVLVRAVLKGARSATVKVRARFGNRSFDLGTAKLSPGGFARLSRTIEVKNPKLWEPGSPNLYSVALTATSGGKRVASYGLRTGIRQIRVTGDGRLMLNGKYLNIRGVGLHEDDQKLGLALDAAARERIVRNTVDLGATLMRAHYPMHPHMHELADEKGLLIWSEIPVYSIKTRFLKQSSVRKLAAQELRKNIEANWNHPSVLLWSVANELSSRPGPVQGDYIRRATRLAKQLDPTRPVGIAVAGYPNAGCQSRYYAPLDVIGINEYFGWYPGPNGQIFDRTKLSGYLDDVRACYPDKAVMVSEFGAEANRDGPVEEKGTWAFQQDFVNYHLGVHGTKPWLSGSVYWALEEFKVRPGWDGGNPRPNPPVHEKGLVEYDGTRKPAYADVQRLFRATQQLIPVSGPPTPARRR